MTSEPARHDLSPPLMALADALRPLAGARIALIAPAGGVQNERIDTALAVMACAGIHAWLAPHARDHYRYLAGTVEARLADFHQAFAEPDVDAVWCLRGGYGSAQLVSAIDWARVSDDVPLIGYSDITVLLDAARRHGKTAWHGPTATDLAMPGEDNAGQAARLASIAWLPRMLGTRTAALGLTQTTASRLPISGQLVGGNLTTLASMAGTPWALALDQPSLLLLEDVGEAEFRLERCLDQLLCSLDTTRLQAVILGEFSRCRLANDPHSWQAIVAEHLADRNIPWAAGAALGHGMHNLAWPVGGYATLDDETLSWD